MFGNIYNPQASIERINNQIAELEKLKSQIPQQPMQPQMPTNLTQNFQLAPSNQGSMKYASTIDEVSKEICYVDTPFFSKDLSVLWIKNAKGDIRAFTLTEIIKKDEKDLIIENLQMQINELKKGMVNNAKSNDDDVNEPVESKKSSVFSNDKPSKAK